MRRDNKLRCGTRLVPMQFALGLHKCIVALGHTEPVDATQVRSNFHHCSHTYTQINTVLKLLPYAVIVMVSTLDIMPLCESSLQKCSGIACVLKGSHNFTCTPICSSAIGTSHTCLCLPRYSWYSFADPRGMEG